MKIIEVNKVNNKNSRGCNNCSARNYKSEFSDFGHYVDKMYELRISSICISLCESCMREVSTKIEKALSTVHPTEKDG